MVFVSAQHPAEGKRKVGRPIAYCGDPDSPDLTPAERRRIKRRIANRESARRVRARRQGDIEEMSYRWDGLAMQFNADDRSANRISLALICMATMSSYLDPMHKM